MWVLLKCEGLVCSLHSLVLWLILMSRRIYKLTNINQSVFNWPDGEHERTVILDVYCPQSGSIHAPENYIMSFSSWRKATNLYWVSTVYQTLCSVLPGSLYNLILTITQEDRWYHFKFFRWNCLNSEHVPQWFHMWA